MARVCLFRLRSGEVHQSRGNNNIFQMVWLTTNQILMSHTPLNYQEIISLNFCFESVQIRVVRVFRLLHLKKLRISKGKASGKKINIEIISNQSKSNTNNNSWVWWEGTCYKTLPAKHRTGSLLEQTPTLPPQKLLLSNGSNCMASLSKLKPGPDMTLGGPHFSRTFMNIPSIVYHYSLKLGTPEVFRTSTFLYLSDLARCRSEFDFFVSEVSIGRRKA